MNSLKDIEFNFVDVETTGLSLDNGDRIIEIAAVKVKGLKVIDSFETLVDPQREISYSAFLVNGISDDMLNGAPIAGSVLPRFLDFVSTGYLVAHNAKFDLRFINNELSMNGLDVLTEDRALDTIKMARAIVPGLGSYSLQPLANFLDVRESQIHRAMADVDMTYKVFLKLIEIAQRKGLGSLHLLLDIISLKKKNNIELQAKIEKIQKAISREDPLKMLYSSASSGVTLRTVTPKEIMGKGRSSKLMGFCHLRNEERVFVLDKIIFVEEIE